MKYLIILIIFQIFLFQTCHKFSKFQTILANKEKEIARGGFGRAFSFEFNSVSFIAKTNFAKIASKKDKNDEIFTPTIFKIF